MITFKEYSTQVKTSIASKIIEEILSKLNTDDLHDTDTKRIENPTSHNNRVNALFWSQKARNSLARTKKDLESGAMVSLGKLASLTRDITGSSLQTAIKKVYDAIETLDQVDSQVSPLHHHLSSNGNGQSNLN